VCCAPGRPCARFACALALPLGLPPPSSFRQGAPNVRVIRGSGAELASLLNFVERNCAVLAQTPMTPAAFEQLYANKDKAGYQKGKDRGTFQSTSLAKMQRDGGALGAFLDGHMTKAVGEDGSVINIFLNVNGGCSPEETAAIPLEHKIKSGGGDNGGWHHDNPSEGKKDQVNTGRILSYYMCDGQKGSLRVRRGSVEVEIIVPRGCSLYCTVELLDLDHAHGANGRSVTVVTEVHRPTPVVCASPAAIAEADAAQASLPLQERFGVWEPWLFFLGPVLKWGAGRGSGSVRRAAVAALWGPKGAREMTRKDARERVKYMTLEEMKKTAETIYSAMGAYCGREAAARESGRAAAVAAREGRVLGSLEGGGGARSCIQHFLARVLCPSHLRRLLANRQTQRRAGGRGRAPEHGGAR
jgi:hypothetical protein